MADIKCAKCGEPWDAYGVRHGDMRPEEAERFLRGEGCPCCGFGSYCPLCSGTGLHDDPFSSRCGCCYGHGVIRVHRPLRRLKTAVHTRRGEPKTYPFSEIGKQAVLGVRQLPYLEEVYTSVDGPVEIWLVLCPDCKAEGIGMCSRCEGTGQLVTYDEDADLEAAKSEIEASDEDPVEILIRRGLV